MELCSNYVMLISAHMNCVHWNGHYESSHTRHHHSLFIRINYGAEYSQLVASSNARDRAISTRRACNQLPSFSTTLILDRPTDITYTIYRLGRICTNGGCFIANTPTVRNGNTSHSNYFPVGLGARYEPLQDWRINGYVGVIDHLRLAIPSDLGWIWGF